jgi:transcriptional regulator with XRE-family HTH domain
LIIVNGVFCRVMEDIRHTVARNLRRLRNQKELSQEELAFEAGLDRSYLSGMERGLRNPTIIMLAKLAGALGVEPHELLVSKATRPSGRPTR